MVMLLYSSAAQAHVRPGELSRLWRSNHALYYLGLGFQHILPAGTDHILFILTLFLLSPKLKAILWQATAFTLAHSITLGLSLYHVLRLSPAIIEPLITLSILVVALENVCSPKLRPARIGLVFLFGLVHGLGFAGALQRIGLPRADFLKCLLMFNLGVEAGQVTVILLAYLLIARWFRDKSYYRKWIVIPASVVIAFIALCWTVQRIISK